MPVALCCCVKVKNKETHIMMIGSRFFKISLSFLILMVSLAASVRAQEAEKLPIPRFVSLKSNKINVRVGPRQDYAILWIYQRQGLPVEIIQEYDNWRKIRDADGSEGWIMQTLLSGNRTMIVAPWDKNKSETVRLYNEPTKSAATIAFLEPGVIGKIRNCNGSWCRVAINSTSGWIEQNSIWGAYPGENVN